MTVQKRILVVDDEPDFAAIVQGNLEKEGFLVDVAYNGVEGLEKVKASPHKNLQGLLRALATLPEAWHAALVGDYQGDSFWGCHEELV